MGGEQESERHGVEGDPAGLGVEADGGDLGMSCVADAEQGRDAQDVQHPDQGQRAGDQQKRLGKAQLAARVPEPAEAEQQGQGEAFDPGTTGRDGDSEMGKTDLVGDRIRHDLGIDNMEQAGDEAERCLADEEAAPGVGIVPDGFDGGGEQDYDERRNRGIEPREPGAA